MNLKISTNEHCAIWQVLWSMHCSPICLWKWYHHSFFVLCDIGFAEATLPKGPLRTKNTMTYLDSRGPYCRTPETWFGSEFSVKWFGFRPESQGYRPKVGVTDQKSEIQPGRPPESKPNRLEKGPEWGLGASAETPLKAFLNPPKLWHSTP